MGSKSLKSYCNDFSKMYVRNEHTQGYLHNSLIQNMMRGMEE